MAKINFINILENELLSVDPAVLEPASITHLREIKQFVKLIQRRDKEIDTLRRKHEKVQTASYKTTKSINSS